MLSKKKLPLGILSETIVFDQSIKINKTDPNYIFFLQELYEI